MSFHHRSDTSIYLSVVDDCQFWRSSLTIFNSTSKYLDDLLNIDNPYFDQMVDQIYPTELQLNKANSSGTEALFPDMDLSITNGIVSSKIYDKRYDFNFEIVNFPFLDGDVPPLSMGYIFRSLFILQECSLMFMTSTTETYH